MITLEKIIKGCLRNKSKSQQLLFERYAGRMKFICLRYLHAEADAQDALQEGFIKLFNNIKQFDNKGHFEAWMSRIFINTAISMLRKSKTLQEEFCVSETGAADIAEEPDFIREELHIDDINEDTIDFEVVKEADFDKEELLQCINTLNPIFSTVFNLYFIDGFQHKEIADMLNISEKTSRTRLLRGRKKIQEELYRLSIKKLTQKA